ncbi:MAG: DHA2 family efflux MFS transporter permease subunit [bacterium]|nr:DHA2 family efflux MFS transporter permease subunit [bacterium]
MSEEPGKESQETHSTGLMLPPIQRRLVTVAVIIGSFLAVMDVSVVNVSLPHMMGTFGVNISAATWIATSYSISEIIMITMAAWWTTLLGRKRFLLLSFGLFTIFSILAGTSSTFTEMIIYRTLQGVGGGGLIPLGQAILRESYPPNRQGMAMAFYGMGVVLAPALGPVVGGWLTEDYGWPWIFYINIPFSVLGMVLVNAYVSDPSYLKRGIRKVDWGGIILLGVGLTGMQIVMERGQEEDWFDSHLIIVSTVVTIVALVAMIIWEMKVEEPIVDFRLLRNSPLSVTCIISLIFGVALFGTTFVLPQFVQNLLEYTAFHAGMVLLPRGIALFLVLPIVGRLYNYTGPRTLVTFGVSAIVFSLFDLSHLSLDVSVSSLAFPLFIMGLGMPAIFVTLSTVALGSVTPAETTAAAGLFTLARRVGGNIGYALLTTLLARRFALHRVTLIPYLTDMNGAFIAYKENLISFLLRQQVDLYTANAKALALIERMLNRQATMLAYNDLYWFMAILFIAIFPLIFFLPARAGFRRQMRG